MAIPDFQSLLLPLLKKAQDGQEHLLGDTIAQLAEQLHLTPQEKKELLPSGAQEVFDNRVGWARTYLKKAGLLESTGRGKLRITTRGSDVLKGNPEHINVKFLKQFAEFAEFHRTPKKTESDLTADDPRTVEVIPIPFKPRHLGVRKF